MESEIYNTFLNSWWPIIFTCIISSVIAIRIYVAGKDCPTNNQVTGKIVLITGASGGLGLETAKQLAARGAQIIVTCRNMEKGKRALGALMQAYPHATVVLKHLDISILSKIYEFVKALEEEYEKIDILINNAGIIFHPHEITLEGFELTVVTNYLGPFTLTHLLLPLLSKSDNGRIINVTSQAHYAAQLDLSNLNSEKEFRFREVFGQTKLALLLFTRHLGKLLKPTKITVNAVNPGLVRNTGHLRKSSMETSLPTKILVWPWMWLFMKTPEQGCQTIVYVASESYLSAITGGYFCDCELKDPSLTARDSNLAKKLYETTCKMCKINGDAIVKKLESINKKGSGEEKEEDEVEEVEEEEDDEYS